MQKKASNNCNILGIMCVCVCTLGSVPGAGKRLVGWVNACTCILRTAPTPPAARLDPVIRVRNSSGCLKLGQVMAEIFN